MNQADVDRFWAKVDRNGDDGCWVWLASVNHNRGGYGQFRLGGQVRRVHRLAYELVKGEIPADLQLDHLCRNRRCVNPDHLEPVTPVENTRRSPISPTAIRGRQTECIRGHPFDEANTYWHRGMRKCKRCSRLRKKRAA